MKLNDQIAGWVQEPYRSIGDKSMKIIEYLFSFVDLPLNYFDSDFQERPIDSYIMFMRFAQSLPEELTEERLTEIQSKFFSNQNRNFVEGIYQKIRNSLHKYADEAEIAFNQIEDIFNLVKLPITRLDFYPGELEAVQNLKSLSRKDDVNIKLKNHIYEQSSNIEFELDLGSIRDELDEFVDSIVEGIFNFFVNLGSNGRNMQAGSISDSRKTEFSSPKVEPEVFIHELYNKLIRMFESAIEKRNVNYIIAATSYMEGRSGLRMYDNVDVYIKQNYYEHYESLGVDTSRISMYVYGLVCRTLSEAGFQLPTGKYDLLVDLNRRARIYQKAPYAIRKYYIGGRGEQ